MRAPRCLAAAVTLCAAAVALGTPRAAADETTAADAIGAWRDAVGGATKLESLGAVRVQSRSSESGIAGTVDDLILARSAKRVWHEGDDRLEEVTDGTRAWLRDWNGKVRAEEGRDLADDITAALVRSLVFAGPAPALVAGAVVETDPASPGFTILALAPPGGVPVRLFVDAKTGLPARAVRPAADDDIVLTFADWRAVDGVTVPFTLSETEGAGEPSVLNVDTVAFRARAPAGSFERPRDGRSDVHFAHGDAALGIPFNFENDHIMIACRVGASEPIWFMFDTGAEATIINKPRLKELGLKPFGANSISGGGNSTDYAYVRVPSLVVGGVTLTDQRNGVIDLSGLEKIYGMPMGGILGYDFASRFVIRVDYDRKVVDLYDPKRHAPPETGQRVPFILEGACPHIAGTISVPGAPPIPADFVLDSGAAETANLTAPFVKQHRLLERARKAPPAEPNTVPGMEKQFFAQTSVRGELSAITLGPVEVHRIPVNLQQGTSGAYASASFSGTIGEGILKRFTGTYDYSRGAIVLAPNAEFTKPFPPRKTFGVTFLTEGEPYTVFRVNGVRKDSPAEAAGFRKDDVVTALDGKPAAELRVADLRKALLDDGTHHAVTLARAGSEPMSIEFTVTLLSLEDL